MVGTWGEVAETDSVSDLLIILASKFPRMSSLLYSVYLTFLYNHHPPEIFHVFRGFFHAFAFEELLVLFLITIQSAFHFGYLQPQLIRVNEHIKCRV